MGPRAPRRPNVVRRLHQRLERAHELLELRPARAARSDHGDVVDLAGQIDDVGADRQPPQARCAQSRVVREAGDPADPHGGVAQQLHHDVDVLELEIDHEDLPHRWRRHRDHSSGGGGSVGNGVSRRTGSTILTG
jgi:hypothetical protein